MRYQYKLLDHRYHHLKCEEREHENDRLAQNGTRSLSTSGIVEVWQEGRFICRLEADGTISLR